MEMAAEKKFDPKPLMMGVVGLIGVLILMLAVLGIKYIEYGMGQDTTTTTLMYAPSTTFPYPSTTFSHPSTTFPYTSTTFSHPSTTFPYTSTTLFYDENGVNRAVAIQILTKNYWSNERTQRASGDIRYSEFRLKSDYTFSWVQFEDGVDPIIEENKWEIGANQDGSWKIILGTGRDLQLTFFKNGYIMLYNSIYEPTFPINVKRPYHRSTKHILSPSPDSAFVPKTTGKDQVLIDLNPNRRTPKIWVRYTLPIVYGKKMNFEVFVRSHYITGHYSPWTLERVGVTREKNNINNKKFENRILEMLLENITLLPGDSYNFTFPMTVWDPGKNDLYFNALHHTRYGRFMYSEKLELKSDDWVLERS